MAAFFGPSQEDLEHLRSTVQSLGSTTVPGLAAALSWRERRTQKVLARELERPGTPVVYDPGRHTVRWARPLPEIPTAPVALVAPPLAPSRPALPSAPGPVLTPAGLKTLCPSCKVPLQSTGTASLAVCPSCGRLSSVRTGTTAVARDSAPVAVRPPAAPTPSATSASDAGAPLSDRRSQELFAAWVNAQPIPCPKCRTPLRHRGVSEYACPTCGQMVRFPSAPSAPPLPAARSS